MDILQQLGQLGFTEYEAKVYLALLAEHPVSGYQISKAAGVPRSMVYEALGRLEVRGAVWKTEEQKSVLFRPVAPDELLDRYQHEAEQRVAALRVGLGPIYQDQPDHRVWNFTGRKEALAHANQMIATATRELMLVLTDLDLEALREGLTVAHGRGVSLGLLLTGDGQFPLGRVARHPQRETQAHRMEETLVVVADEGEVLISSGQRACAVTVTNNPNLVQIARQFVWMELFAQRVFARLGKDLLDRLDPEDRQILE